MKQLRNLIPLCGDYGLLDVPTTFYKVRTPACSYKVPSDSRPKLLVSGWSI